MTVPEDREDEREPAGPEDIRDELVGSTWGREAADAAARPGLRRASRLWRELVPASEKGGRRAG